MLGEIIAVAKSTFARCLSAAGRLFKRLLRPAVLATTVVQPRQHRRFSLRSPPIAMVEPAEDRPCDDLPSCVEGSFAVGLARDALLDSLVRA